jgi:hypothetical protein
LCVEGSPKHLFAFVYGITVLLSLRFYLYWQFCMYVRISTVYRICVNYNMCLSSVRKNYLLFPYVGSRGELKCDGTRARTRFRLSVKRTSPFKSAGGGGGGHSLGQR